MPCTTAHHTIEVLKDLFITCGLLVSDNDPQLYLQISLKVICTVNIYYITNHHHSILLATIAVKGLAET